MPIYEYICDGCATRFEKLVLRPGREQVVCPACGQDRLTQQLTTFASPVRGKFKDTSRPSWAEHPHPEDVKHEH
jgi:putative FmdB family regulatory protein